MTIDIEGDINLDWMKNVILSIRLEMSCKHSQIISSTQWVEWGSKEEEGTIKY